ncbi:hypothetical protein HJC23_006460 [Cyclotella cryptica]|uniref:Uncharacterized protein n=1 Tax=Cyclotella cryptica TaxID=29204 RepID=A0ABD3QUI5_9STRA
MAIILIDLSNVNISPALEYYYTADEACLANGPHFDYTYFITVTGIVGCIVNFFGVMLYQTFLSGWKFRPVLIFTIAIGSLSNATDLFIVMGWNRMMGISDKVFFLFGNAIFDSLTDILMKIPRASMIAKMAPPKMESTVFAFSVGIANFCIMLSRLIGSGIIQQSGMKTVGVDCDFGKLPELIATVQILLPLAIGIPASFLVPNVFQADNFINWEAEGWCHDDAPGPFENEDSGAQHIKDQQLHEMDG